MTQEELDQVKSQVDFMKKWRSLLQFGTFYRLKSPFEGNIGAWMTVSGDRGQAIAGWYRILNVPNPPYSRLRLAGLDPEALYRVSEDGETLGEFYGDELMYAGLVASDKNSGDSPHGGKTSCDFASRLYVIEKME